MVGGQLNPHQERRSKMPRPRSIEPALKKKGKRGNYYFRRQISKKDKIINTGTTDLKEAEAFRKRYMESEITATVEQQQTHSAINAVSKIIGHLTGTELKRITFDEGYRIYVENNTAEHDLSKQYRQQFASKVRQFGRWCETKGIYYLDEVDDSVARQYSIHLWDQHIAASTHDCHIKILSKFFQDIDILKHLPCRNPFDARIVKRKQIGLRTEASHQALTTYMVSLVLKAAGEAGQEWLDLFILGLNTGMRLKDAALLEWRHIDGDVLSYCPYKTRKYQTMARVGISPVLQEMLNRRMLIADHCSPYINPVMAHYYFNGSIKDGSQEIFDAALGREVTHYPCGEHRKKNTCIYGFHSFRVTFTTELARQQVHYRDAMRMLGWTSMEMVRHYEREMEEEKGERDKKSLNAVRNMPTLKFSPNDIPIPAKHLTPTEESLGRLVNRYSNIAIGKIFDISNVAVGHWLKKFGLKRTQRLLTPDLSEEEIQRIRQELQAA